MSSYKECVLIPFSVYEFLRNCEHESIRDAVTSVNIKQLNHFSDLGADKINIRYVDGDKSRGSVQVSKTIPKNPPPKKESPMHHSQASQTDDSYFPSPLLSTKSQESQTDDIPPTQRHLSMRNLGGENIPPVRRELSSSHLGGENIPPVRRELSSSLLGGENIPPVRRELSSSHLGGENIPPVRRELSSSHLGGENIPPVRRELSSSLQGGENIPPVRRELSSSLQGGENISPGRKVDYASQTDGENGDPIYKSRVMQTNDKLFSCSTCGVGFANYYNKKRHENKFHPYPLKKRWGNNQIRRIPTEQVATPIPESQPKVKLSDLGWKSYLIPLSDSMGGGKLSVKKRSFLNKQVGVRTAAGGRFIKPFPVNKKGRMGKKRNKVSFEKLEEDSDFESLPSPLPSPPPPPPPPSPEIDLPENSNTKPSSGSSNSKASAGRNGSKRKRRSKLEVMHGILKDDDQIMSLAKPNKRQRESFATDYNNDYDVEWDDVKMKKRKLQKQKME